MIRLFALLWLWLLAGCRESSPPTVALPTPARVPATLLTVQAGSPREFTHVGSVVSDLRVDVASRLSAYVLSLTVREGDAVHAGQVLARLDATDLEGNIRQAEAGVAAAEAAAADARTDAERVGTLYAQGHISDNEWRKVKLRESTTAEALQQAKAMRTTTRAQRLYTEIRSPRDGVVVAAYLRSGDLATPGRPLLTLESGQALFLETAVPERQLALLKVGALVSVQLDGLTAPLAGEVARIIPSADPVTRGFPVKIRLPATPGLMPGLFGRVVFRFGEDPDPVVPVSALTERGGLRGVFVADGDGYARFRWLRLGREWPDRVVVTAGLGAGERIVAAPAPQLRDGDRLILAGESRR